MSHKFFKAWLLVAASVLPLAQAQAHTTSVGYSPDGPGAVTFWYGTYHDSTEASYNEGTFHLLGTDVTYDQTVAFTLLVTSKPTGLVDGTTNFYTNGTALSGILTRPTDNPQVWQGVSFTSLLAGTYHFTYIPASPATDVWAPRDSIILSNDVTLSAADLGGPATTPTAPTVIDSSQGSFSQTDAAASGSTITFAGGVFAPTTGVNLDKPVTLQSAGGVIDSGQGDVALTNVVSGAGGLTKTGEGNLTLSGANTYSGGTVIKGGALIGDTNSLHGTIDNGAALVFDQKTDGAFDGSISGTGVLTKQGTGELALNGPNTSSGGTMLKEGTLSVGTEGGLGTGALAATGGTLKLGYSGGLTQDVLLPTNGTLTIDTQANKVVSSGDFAGTGAFTKTGTGLLNLTGDNSNYTGTADVAQGRLAVNGAMGGATATVEDGAEIGGNGTLGGLIVKTNATAAPGNSIGKLTVGTFVIFEPRSAYAVELDATGANDRIDVTGTATLQGGTVKVMAAAGTYNPVTTYTILNAQGGISGRFENVVSNLAFLSPELSYTTNAVTLTLVRNDQTFASVARTANQQAVGGAVDRVFGYGTGIYDSLVRGAADEARDTFDQLSGEIYGGVMTTAIADGDTVRGALVDHLRGPAAQGKSVWADAFGAWGDVKGDGNAASLKRDTQGFLMGVEAASDAGFRVGLAGGYSDTNADVNARRSSSDIETGHVWAYGAAQRGAWSLRGGVGYGDLRVKTQRTIALKSVADRLTSDADASLAQAFAEVSYAMTLSGLQVEPMASLTAYRLKTDGFVESGGATALTAQGVDHDLSASTLGVRAGEAFGRGDVLDARLSLAWRHTLQDMDPTALVAFKSGGQAFSVAGTPIDEDSFVIDAGLDWKISDKLSAGAAYQGAIGKRAEDHALKAKLSYSF